MVEIAPERPLPPLPQAPSKKARPARPGFRALLAVAVLGAVAFNRFAVPGGLRRVPANSVGIIDASSGAIASRLPLQGRPGGAAAGADSVWVTDEVSGRLPLINERGIDLISERVGNYYQRNPQLGVLLDQLWVE